LTFSLAGRIRPAVALLLTTAVSCTTVGDHRVVWDEFVPSCGRMYLADQATTESCDYFHDAAGVTYVHFSYRIADLGDDFPEPPKSSSFGPGRWCVVEMGGHLTRTDGQAEGEVVGAVVANCPRRSGCLY
jgi:hypothetical protein